MYKDKDLKAWIDLSTYCNARCPQCHRNDINGLGKADWLPLVQWDVEQFKNAYTPETMKLISKFEICGTWGDPMMCKDIYEICEYIINNSNSWIQINTNGGMRDELFWFKLGGMGKNRMQVIFAVEGINQKMHSKYRRNVDFNKLAENVTAYTDGGGNAFAHILVFKHNENYLQQIIDMCMNEWGICDYLCQASNRFFTGNEFEFWDEQGDRQTLEELTNKDNPLLGNVPIAPLRDHKWWNKKGKETREKVGLWTPKK